MEQPFSIDARIIFEFIRSHFKRGEWTTRDGEAIESLLDINRPATLRELSNKNEAIPTQPECLYQLALRWNLTDLEKFTGLASSSPQRKLDTLPSGDANCAEIEVLAWGENVLADPKYAPTNKYVAVYVDDVSFRQEDKDTGGVLVKNGK